MRNSAAHYRKRKRDAGFAGADVVTVRNARRTAQSTGREAAASHWLQWLARGGLVARGVNYMLIGLLAVQVAFGSKGKQANSAGAQRRHGRGGRRRPPVRWWQPGGAARSMGAAGPLPSWMAWFFGLLLAALPRPASGSAAGRLAMASGDGGFLGVRARQATRR
jgi:hypothetical protein